jgi:signal transduction histidine kinase
LRYNRPVIRKRLSVQLALVLLGVSLVPLGGVALLTLHLIRKSMTEQVRTSQEQVARAAAALVRDYLNDATTKLKNIAQRIDPRKDPQAETEKLNAQVNPPGIFLEVSYIKSGEKPVVVAQGQQQAYTLAQNDARSPNRAFNPEVGQYSQQFTNDDPIVQEPQRGNSFWARTLDNVGAFNGLPISVPAVGKDVLVATLDFAPVSRMFASIAGGDAREIQLLGPKGTALVRAGRSDSSPEPIVHHVPVGHADWQIRVSEIYPRAILESVIQTILGFCLAAAIALGMAAILGGRILRPIRALASTADAIGRGDYAARSSIRREDEIGQLAVAFDRMAAAVQDLDRVKGEFVAHVSHELRTPLTSAKVSLANVQEGIAGPDAISRVQQDLDRLIRMVNEILDVARIEAGIKLARERTHLGDLVTSAIDTLRPIARVPIAVTGCGAEIEVDRARIHQVIVNLVDNAIKYARSRVDVTLNGIEVRVTDDGPGVPPEHREKIFEKFAKVETGPKPPGVGLGLSIARKIAQLHGGSLVCEGNTFVLRL